MLFKKDSFRSREAAKQGDAASRHHRAALQPVTHIQDFEKQLILRINFCSALARPRGRRCTNPEHAAQAARSPQPGLVSEAPRAGSRTRRGLHGHRRPRVASRRCKQHAGKGRTRPQKHRHRPGYRC